MTKVGQYRIQSFAFVISIFVAFFFSCVFVSNLIGLESVDTGNEIRLDSRINPNTAPVASMTRLPGIGIAKAEAIVAYRHNFRGSNGESRPFQNMDDLQKVNGIGPKTVQNISEWLKFK